MRETIEQMLDRARHLAATGQGADAQKTYVEILSRDPVCFAALNELAILAHESGHRSAARTLYEQAVCCHPGDVTARINLGSLLFEAGEAQDARLHFEAALKTDPASLKAHRGLAQSLTALGEPAELHWRKSFNGQALEVRRYRGTRPGVRVLLLVSARGGNIPLQAILDDRTFAITALYAEYYDPALPLPPHDLLFNAIGDADLCPMALERAVEIAARSDAPILNSPQAVRRTGRAENARRLADVPGVIAPAIRTFTRDQPPVDMDFPLLLRAPGFHTGQHFLRVEHREELPAAMETLPGEKLLAIQYLDARGADGLARKYRVMIIDGELYPVHLAISSGWKVHYFTAETNAAHREEEKRFLENMPEILGPRAIAALRRIGKILALDYMGVDFAPGKDGALLLFEANATMVLNPPDGDPVWDYRRAPVARALEVARRMALARAQDA